CHGKRSHFSGGLLNHRILGVTRCHAVAFCRAEDLSSLRACFELTPWSRREPTPGSAGEVTKGQVGVGLAIATDTEQVPIDFELYLSESWANAPRSPSRSLAFSTAFGSRAVAANIFGEVLLR